MALPEAPEQAAPQMQVRPATVKLETGRSDPWVATHVAASKASGIKIVGARAEWYARVRADGRARAQSRKDTIVKQACFKGIRERCCAEV